MSCLNFTDEIHQLKSKTLQVRMKKLALFIGKYFTFFFLPARHCFSEVSETLRASYIKGV